MTSLQSMVAVTSDDFAYAALGDVNLFPFIIIFLYEKLYLGFPSPVNHIVMRPERVLPAYHKSTSRLSKIQEDIV